MQNLNQKNLSDFINNLVDQDLDQTIGSLKALKDIQVDGSNIDLHFEMVQPIQYISKYLQDTITTHAQKLDEKVQINFKFTEKPLSNNKQVLKDVKHIVAIASGKGGVGKSAVSSNIAAALAKSGAKVGILDGDIYGPSQPTMYGLKGSQLDAIEMPDGSTMAKPAENHGVKVASMGFVMNPSEAAIVRGPLLASYFTMLFEQVNWGELDYLLFDLPPGTGDIQLTLTQKIPLNGAVIVTTPQEISLADVRRSISMFNRVDVDILGIVENMSYFIPPDMPEKKYYIFGEGGGETVAKETETELFGQIPLNIKMREGNDGGKPYVLDDNAGEQGRIIEEIAQKLVKKLRVKNHASQKNAGLEILL
ncbi:MAG: Mrp/NBP35 family ATP-binding protein [Bacteroidales bacterium]